MTLYPLEVKKTTSPDSADYANFGIIENLNSPSGKGALICLSPEIMPATNKDIVVVPVWEI